MTQLDYVVIIVYLVGIIAVGLLSKGKEDTADDYFAASGRMGGWLNIIIVGLSITATFFSGLSFVTIPSIVISDGIKVMLIVLTLPLSMWIVCRWFIPRYRAFNVVQPYEIISRHIGMRTRYVTSGLFVALRTGWMAALLYAPTLLLIATMRLDERWLWPLILMMGLSATFYTVLGGLKSVLITDAIQMLIVIGSLVTAVVCGLMQLPFEPVQWLKTLSDGGKLTAPSFSLDVTERFTVFGIMLGITVSNLATYMGDQMSLQRYIAMKDVASVQRSFRINIYGAVLTLLLLFALGFIIVLWNTGRGVSDLTHNTDLVFPQFVAAALPSGLCGLMVAAILSATMDSIASGINGLAGSITIDFIKPNFRRLSDQALVKLGKIISLAVGVGATVGAGLLSKTGSLYDLSQAILGVFLGPILGVVVLAMLQRRLNETRVLWAILISCIVGVAVTFTAVQSIWITFIGSALCLLIAWPFGAPPLVKGESREP